MKALLRQFNWVEGFFWIALGGAALWYGVRRRRGRMGVIVGLAAGLAAFGVSDFVETWSGAWWEPWWLLGWKAVCLAVIGACVAVLVRGQGVGWQGLRQGECSGTTAAPGRVVCRRRKDGGWSG